MNATARQTPDVRRGLLTLLAVVLGGALAVSGLTFAVGSLMGTYEGEHGLWGFLGEVFGAALQGRPGALVLLLSPSLCLATWWLVFRLLRYRPRTSADHDTT